MKATTRFLTTLALSLGLAGGAAASVELVGNAPFLGYADGSQSVPYNPPPYSQSFTAPANAILESIRWWGYHNMQESLGSDYDDFLVTLDGNVQTGGLRTPVVVATQTLDKLKVLYEYTLDLDTEIALTSSTLSIVNNSDDVDWYWQHTTAIGSDTSPASEAVAFSLIGRFESQTPGTPIPEPGGLPLLLLGIAALALQKKSQAKIPTYRQ